MKTAVILIFVAFYAFTDAASVSDGTALSLKQIEQLFALQERNCSWIFFKKILTLRSEETQNYNKYTKLEVVNFIKALNLILYH